MLLSLNELHGTEMTHLLPYVASAQAREKSLAPQGLVRSLVCGGHSTKLKWATISRIT